MQHVFNDRLFCKNCGVDAIGLTAKGSAAIECPGRTNEPPECDFCGGPLTANCRAEH